MAIQGADNELDELDGEPPIDALVSQFASHI